MNILAAGGIVMWPLLLFSIVAIALIVERLAFWLRINRRQRVVMQDILRTYQHSPVEVYPKLRQNLHLPTARIFQEALEIEFGLQNLPFEREKWLSIYFKGRKLSKRYRADFFCFDKIIVEIKAVSSVPKDTTAQILNYLKGTKCRVGVLLNFGQPKLEFKRYIR
mgnify:CR=1 FL=1